MFESINEIAVIATAALMMAVSTIWYSSLLFGTAWSKVAKISPEDVAYGENHLLSMAVGTFLCNVLVFGVLAYMSALAPIIGLSVLKLSIGIVLFLGALLITLTLAEYKSRLYFLMHAGYLAMYIVGGMVVINYWPW